MGISCIIVEDQPPAQRVLQKYITDIGTLNLKGIFADALGALKFLNAEKVDLIFLDVHLPKLSGIEFLKILNPKPKIILTTAFSDYALEGYELDVQDYLLKPFSFERFVKAVSKISSQLEEPVQIIESSDKENAKSKTSTFVKSGSEYLNVDFRVIKYIKSDGDYTRLYLQHVNHLISHPLRYWLEILPSEQFCQVHKSYIVNVKFISKVNGNQISIGELMIPIGRTYKEVFFTQYLDNS